MSPIIIGVLAFVIILVGLITFNFYRMKNAKPVENSKRIKVLGNKNFKPAVRRGITLVDFWAPWCAPCKVVAPVLNDIADERDDIIVGKVNVDHHQQLARKYKVRNIPTLIMFRDGAEYKRFVGVKSKKFLLKEVNAAMA